MALRASSAARWAKAHSTFFPEGGSYRAMLTIVLAVAPRHGPVWVVVKPQQVALLTLNPLDFG